MFESKISKILPVKNRGCSTLIQKKIISNSKNYEGLDIQDDSQFYEHRAKTCTGPQNNSSFRSTLSFSLTPPFTRSLFSGAPAQILEFAV